MPRWEAGGDPTAPDHGTSYTSDTSGKSPQIACHGSSALLPTFFLVGKLIPKTHKYIMALYGRVEYWNERYRKTESKGPYDWYQSYHSIRHLLSVQALMAATKLDASRPFPSYDKCRVLILGCGNSTFGEDMIRDGWKGQITNIDFSPVVVEQMKKKYCTPEFAARYSCTPMEFVCGDITKGLPFDDKSFDLIICKGTFDAILCSNGSVANAKTLVAECSRVLANGHGVLFLVSYGNPDSRVVFLEHENDLAFYWKEVTIHNLARSGQEGRGKISNAYAHGCFVHRNDFIYICRKRVENVSRGRPVSQYGLPLHQERSMEETMKENIENLGRTSEVAGGKNDSRTS